MGKFNYVIFGSSWDLYKCAYSSLFRRPDVKYISDPSEPLGILSKLRRIHYSSTANRFFSLPLKGIWNRFYFKDSFQNSKPLCFIFFWGWIANNNETHLTKYLQKHYPGCKCVLFLQDVVKSHDTNYPIEQIKSDFDAIISYDKNDCNKFGFLYHPTVLSPIIVKGDDKVENCDVYFVGQDKGRLPLLVDICKLLSSHGLKCDFYVVSVSIEKRISCESIHYIDESFSYYQNLQHVKKSKCLLELMQDEAVGYTFRTWEAITYSKFLLTNNTEIINSPYYESDKIFPFVSKDSISDLYCEIIKNGSCAEYQNRDSIRPESLINFIENSI